MRRLLLLLLLVTPAAASEELDPGGVTNPEEMTLNRVIDNIRRGETSMTNCAVGYMMTKQGKHGNAREVFSACADDGWTRAMTWMSQLDNNGLAGPYDPDAAAQWDRRAAEAGDPVGKFNYGIDLLRGHGVARDEARGRALVDEAALHGLADARRLQAAGYDLDVVTPDADNWKYAPLF